MADEPDTGGPGRGVPALAPAGPEPAPRPAVPRVPVGARPWVLTLVVAVLALVTLVEDLLRPTVVVAGVAHDRGPEATIAAALAVTVAIVAQRRRIGPLAPLAAVAALGAAALQARVWLLESPFVFLLAMLLCGLCGYEASRAHRLAALPVLWTAAGIAEWREPHRAWVNVFLVGGYMTLAWGCGRIARRSAAQIRSAREQAAAAERAVQEERRRIARELHDIVAHSVSVMTVQAGAVRRHLQPDQVRERDALASIEATGRDSLAEMRRLVGLLRNDAAPAYGPQPGLAELDGLVATMSDAGLPVGVSVRGDPRPLTPGKDLTAFRVVQEALTNALRHAGRATARVTLHWSPAELLIEVTDDGRGEHRGAGGHGQAGMRERLELYGGTLDSGPAAGGGYVVRARLPLEATP